MNAHVADLHHARTWVRIGIEANAPDEQAPLLQGVWHVSVAVRNCETGDDDPQPFAR